MRRAAWAGIGILVVAGALAACSGGGSSAKGSVDAASGGGGAAAPLKGAPDAGVPNGGSVAERVGGTSDVTLTSEAKIRTASLTVAVKGSKNVPLKADAADEIALRAGGEVDSDDRTDGTDATADLLLRVPPAALLSVEKQLAALGTEQSRSGSTRDVTGKVADVASRVKSAQDAIVRLRALYARASKVSDVIDVEDQLSSREADLESLQAQQRALTQETAMATVTLRLVTASKVVAKKHHHPAKRQHGFVAGLKSGWHGFTAMLSWLATVLGALLPFLGLVLVLVLLAWLARPHLGRRHPSPAE